MTVKKQDGLTVNEAAQRLGVGVGFAYLLVRSGRLKADRADGRWLVDPASVEDRLKRLRSRYLQKIAASGRSEQK